MDVSARAEATGSAHGGRTGVRTSGDVARLVVDGHRVCGGAPALALALLADDGLHVLGAPVDVLAVCGVFERAREVHVGELFGEGGQVRRC